LRGFLRSARAAAILSVQYEGVCELVCQHPVEPVPGARVRHEHPALRKFGQTCHLFGQEIRHYVRVLEIPLGAEENEWYFLLGFVLEGVRENGRQGLRCGEGLARELGLFGVVVQSDVSAF